MKNPNQPSTCHSRAGGNPEVLLYRFRIKSGMTHALLQGAGQAKEKK